MMTDSGIVVIAIDESGSMSGSWWNNAVKGAKELIEHIRLNNSNIHQMQIVIIFFDDDAHLKHEGLISDPIPESIWTPNYGGTSFGPIFSLAF